MMQPTLPNKTSTKLSVSVKLVSTKDDANSINKSYSGQIQWPENLKVGKMISWNEMLKPENGFVQNNSVTLEVKIEAAKPEGASIDPHHLARPRFAFECYHYRMWSLVLYGMHHQNRQGSWCLSDVPDIDLIG